MDKKIGIFSFFAGAGFLDLGFERTEKFETAFVNEYHRPFMDIYRGARKNMGIPEPMFGHEVKSITDYHDSAEFEKLKEKIEEAKERFGTIGFIGGPPCPDFSVGGKNKGQHGENGKLSGTYVELICNTQPDFFLFENVKGLYRTAKHRAFFESLKDQLHDAGYVLTENLINAIEYGAPQDRQRIILIGFRKQFLKSARIQSNGEDLIASFDWNANKVFHKEDIFKYSWPSTSPFEEDIKKEIAEETFLELTVQHWFEKNDVLNHPNAQHYFTPRNGLPKFQSISEGDDLKKSYKRLHRWRYSPTAAYGNNEVHLHPYKARRLSAAEALAIQSLPKEFVIPNNISLTDMFKTIGNGVPYLAARALALSIYKFIDNLNLVNEKAVYAEADSQ
ncbi:DNA cytosine methyltransferase [Mucilaginibacter sp. Bleaf8]|uniref:DNA cytosine methyltransferase n=1 Tax=Mucilaginibacter sp. Bleaf8 TaxID=2834430 RepID=UPI001BCF52EB|nr:DNA cytosine methyltransferase [Mucilaginibacter sp. Bleaf8]MBS7565653.1 DNA cytosine methyltransferase [Mucilaginibacter sp. Bleaf8]